MAFIDKEIITLPPLLAPFLNLVCFMSSSMYDAWHDIVTVKSCMVVADGLADGEGRPMAIPIVPMWRDWQPSDTCTSFA